MLDGMTNIKASEVLKELKLYTEDLPHYSPDEVAEALEMANKALEQQPNRCDSCIHYEEQDGSNCYECIKGLADNFEAQPCEDCISRSELLRHQHIIYDDDEEDYRAVYVKDIKAMPPVKPQIESSEDCINRTELTQKLNAWDSKAHGIPNYAWKVIREMPSVTPKYTDEEIDRAQAVEQAYVDKMVELAVEETKRPKGKWMECGGDEPWLKGYCCSLCNFTTTQKYDYCTCGAKMEVNTDDRDSN